MVSFRLFFESMEEPLRISPRTIYNFYFLYTYLQTQGTDQFSGFLIQEFAQNIKKFYLKTFQELLARQVQKYIKRGRTDKGLQIGNSISPENLLELISKTFRSDMIRRNDRWIDLANWVVKLSHASSVKDIFFAVDRINNTTHNTQEIILSKFENASMLMDVFDKCHQFKSLGEFRPYIDKEYAKLL